jgi:broad specificity phosphatase PhoE
MVNSSLRGTRIVLVRHARPVIDPDRPGRTWSLAGDAREDVLRLAEAIRPLGCDGVVASPEPKARDTGGIIAGAFDVPCTVDDAFREQGGDAIPWLGDDAFKAAVADHFARPNEVVFGDESSADAARRFAAGVARARAAHGFPLVATHGRVMCGYLAQALGIDPRPIWSTLRLPDALVVDLEEKTVNRLPG